MIIDYEKNCDNFKGRNFLIVIDRLDGSIVQRVMMMKGFSFSTAELITYHVAELFENGRETQITLYGCGRTIKELRPLVYFSLLPEDNEDYKKEWITDTLIKQKLGELPF